MGMGKKNHIVLTVMGLEPRLSIAMGVFMCNVVGVLQLAEWMCAYGTVDIRLLTSTTAVVAAGNFTWLVGFTH
jgi:hypothetical protein